MIFTVLRNQDGGSYRGSKSGRGRAGEANKGSAIVDGQTFWGHFFGEQTRSLCSRGRGEFTPPTDQKKVPPSSHALFA